MKFERNQKRGKLMNYRANGKLPAAGNPNFHSRKSVQMFTVGCGGAPANKKIRPGHASGVPAGVGRRETETRDHIWKPRPTMGTKSWSRLPYFVPGAGVMISLGNAVM